VDKYLEHSRISTSRTAATPEVFLASADWMPRNFWPDRTLFPIEDASLQARIVATSSSPS